MKSNIVKILVISKEQELHRRVKEFFASDRVEVHEKSWSEPRLPHFDAKVYDVLVLVKTDLHQSDVSLKKSVDFVNSKNPSAHIVLLVESEAVSDAIDALESEISQHAELPISDNRLQKLIESGLPLAAQARVNGRSHRTPDFSDKRCDQLVGCSLAMRQVYRQIQQAAATDIPVLLLGETGTGKDLAAQAIHRFSARSQGPYMASNLGAIPNELVASELFGHEKGAFTGALTQREGLFELAANGTLFLDEIEAIAQRMQVGLLRLLEEEHFNRLGGKKMVKNRARLIAACNQDLEKMVQKGKFREDLFYRFDVFRITLPPLRERPGDIPLLAGQFLKEFNRVAMKRVVEIDSESMGLLTSYNWPGNVRELKNVIQRTMVSCDGETISSEHLPSRFLGGKSKQPAVTFEIGTPVDQVKREMIVQTLASVDNNRKLAAQLLGISRRAIYNKFEKYNINIE